MDVKFGTDGIRGIFPTQLSCTTAFLLGRALINISDGDVVVVVGRDTRDSGLQLMSALYSSLNDGGASVIDVGIVPTNAISYFIRLFKADYGIMVSASHNPPQYNGLKVFDNMGLKLCKPIEEKIEKYLSSSNVFYVPNTLFTMPQLDNVDQSYVNYIYNLMPLKLTDLTIAVDCAYGSSYQVAKKLFQLAECNYIGYCDFNKGELINSQCGALHPQLLIDAYQTRKYDLGFCFDGDADRIAVAQQGVLVDNDHIFFAISKFLAERGQLPNNRVVGTVLTNSGVEKALADIGIKLLRADVGDKNVYQMMIKQNACFGGEDSGHYIFSNLTTGSDSLVSALYISHIYKHCGDLLRYTKELSLVPHISVGFNVGVEFIDDLRNSDKLSTLGRELQGQLGLTRLIFRASGTENKVRLYCEDNDNDKLQQSQDAAKLLLKDFLAD